MIVLKAGGWRRWMGSGVEIKLCMTCIHVSMYSCILISLYSYIHVSMYIYIYVFMYPGILVFMYACIQVSWYPGTLVSMYSHILLFGIHVSMYSCIHISLYPGVHISMYPHISCTLVSLYSCIHVYHALSVPQHPLSVGSHKMSHFLAEEHNKLWLPKKQNFVDSSFCWQRKV